MTPDQLAKSDSEHAHQRAFFAWLTVAQYGFEFAIKAVESKEAWQFALRDINSAVNFVPVYPEFKWFHAIPNGGQRGDGTAKGAKIAGAKFKAEGVKPGVLDTMLPVPKRYQYPTGMEDSLGNRLYSISMYNGLYLEFKEPKRKTHANGGHSPEQDEFADFVRSQGYCARTAYTWREAANLVMLYYGSKLSI